jgi:hypothetical protein
MQAREAMLEAREGNGHRHGRRKHDGRVLGVASADPREGGRHMSATARIDDAPVARPEVGAQREPISRRSPRAPTDPRGPPRGKLVAGRDGAEQLVEVLDTDSDEPHAEP